MTKQIVAEREIKRSIKSFIGNFLLFYLFLSFFRFFAYDEPILSVKPIIIGMAIIVATFSMVISLLQSLVKMNRKGKIYRYLVLPIATSIVTYFLLSFIRFVILEGSVLSRDVETILFAIFFGGFEAVRAKIDDLSPRDPKREPAKPIKYYIDTYMVNATPFHKVMFLVYGFCILLLLSILLFAFLDR